MKPCTALSLSAAPTWDAVAQSAMKTAPPIPAKDRARIMIADDSTFMRYGLTRLLSQEIGLEVVGEAVNGQDAVTLARELRPDIIIMDINMPLMDGIEATFLIMKDRPDTLVVGFSSSDEQGIRATMLKAGAVDLINKGESVPTLVSTLHSLWDARG